MTYLDECSEDELIDDVLVPLFRQLQYRRITAAGHKDRSLEYGRDMWMKYMLPTGHAFYFGIQVKKGKLDAAAASKPGSSNISETWTQVQMMLESEVFDTELNQLVPIDRVMIVAGGEITKSARNWLSNRLASKRSPVMFMDRDDILRLSVVADLPLPERALRPRSISGGTF